MEREIARERERETERDGGREGGREGVRAGQDVNLATPHTRVGNNINTNNIYYKRA